MIAAQIEAILALPGPKRYSHFIKVAADERCVWGLFSDGWALSGTDRGVQVFPLWPGREYAERCASGLWAGYEPREIDLDTLFDRLLPKLEESATLAGIFPTPEDQGVTPDLEQFEADLRNELARIE